MTDDSKKTLDILRKMTSLTRQLVVFDMPQTALKAAQEGQDYSAVLRALAAKFFRHTRTNRNRTMPHQHN